MMKMRNIVVSAVAVSALWLAGCSNSEQDSGAEKEAATSAAPASASASDKQTGDVTIEDGVVRAMAEDAEMTAIFGTIHNDSDKDITVTGFSSSIDAEMNQVHEVVDGVMQEKKGGLKIPAGGTAELKPGGEHFMLMGVKEPVMAGETVKVTLLLEDGSKVEAGEVPVREIGAGDENYGDMSGMDHGSMDHGDMSGMDHGSMDHGSMDHGSMEHGEHSHH